MSKYLNSGAAGGGDGTIGTPWNTVQAALDGVASGDEVLCYGSETISADNTSSTSGALGSLIEFVGTDASYAKVAGTRYQVDCNSGAYSAFNFSNTYYYIEAFEIIDSTDKGIESTNQHIYMYDDVFSGCNYGFYTSAQFASAIMCRFINNTYGFWQNAETAFVYNCVFVGHSNYAVTANNVDTNVVDNLFYDNSSTNILMYEPGAVNGNIFDNGGTGVNFYLSNRTYVCKNNLFTNMTTGVTTGGEVLAMNNAYYNNGTDISTPANYKVFGKGNTDIALGAAPYIDASYATTRDYTIDFTNTDLVQLSVPYLDNDTDNRETVGAEPQAPSGTTPTYTSTDLKVEANSHGGFDFTVPAGSDITYYEIYLDTSSLGWGTEEIAGAFLAANATTFSLYTDASGDALVNGTLYYIGVRAINVSASARDANTTELSLAPKGASGKFVVRQQPGGAPQ